MTSSPADTLDRLLREGNALEDSGLLSQAKEVYRRAAKLAPDSPRPLLNIANAMAREGSVADAVDQIQAAIRVAPDFAPAHYNLGHLLMRVDPQRAALAFREALSLNAGFTDARVCLALLATAAGSAAEAERHLREAVTRDPAHVGALQSLGAALIKSQRWDEAEVFIERALAADPSFGPALEAMATICFQCRRLPEAEAWYGKILSADPFALETASALFFTLLARDDLSYEDILARQRSILSVIEGAVGNDHSQGRRAPGSRIRLGYLSPDFHNHAVALFIEPILRAHDRTRFDIHCYYSNDVTDAITERLRAQTEHWRDIATLDDTQATDLIRSDRLDILVDLAGHTARARTLLFMRRCAPVQVTWLGFLGSTGLSQMDYRLCDPVTDPVGETFSGVTEAPLRLPATQWCYSPMHSTSEHARAINSRAPMRFGSFNQFWKISGTSVRMWAAILGAVPRSELLVMAAPPGRSGEVLVAEFAGHGIDPARIKLQPRGGIADYFSAIASVDIALDTTPYTGATTTLDALWSGVPVIALLGDRPVGRSSASILRAAGLPELVAASEDDYAACASNLAADRQRLATLRATLRSRLQSSPLMDAAGLTRSLETRYAEVVARVGSSS